jgi:hypothetical protein
MLQLAERVGFEPVLVVENKDVQRFEFLTIRRIRSNASVETRIEHAE